MKNKEFYHAVLLNPRHALVRGRTSPSCLYKECDKDEKTFYEDFTSLYPSVQKYEYYPVGHVGDECDLSLESMHDLVKCKVLPSRGLLFPVLPSRINGRM